MRRRTRLTVLSVHVATTGVWLGVLTGTLLTPTTRVGYVLIPTAVLAVGTGVWLGRGLWRFGWVHTKAGLTVVVAAAAGVTAVFHLTGRPLAGLRYTAVVALTLATVIAVTKPRRRTHPPATVKEPTVNTYALRVLDRAARTAVQVFAGYLITAHTIGGVQWQTAALAAGFAVVIAIVQGLVDMPAITTLGPVGEVIGRAVRTAAQVALGSAAANATTFADIAVGPILSAAALAAVTSIITSMVSIPIGPPSVRGTTEVFGPPQTTTPTVAAAA
jgi:hypothetical protein